jgi:hypothetical protein
MNYEGTLFNLNKGDAFKMPNDVLRPSKSKWDNVNIITTNNVITLKFENGDKIKFKDYGKTLWDLYKPNAIVANDAFILKIQGKVKRELQDYEGALFDLDKAHVFEPNDVTILNVQGDVK